MIIGQEMAPLLLLEDPQSGRDAVVARRARLRDRLVARWRATKLDCELAAGVAPGTRAALSLRAQTLGEGRVRTMLGTHIRRVLVEASSARTITWARVSPRRTEVLAAAPELGELADRLLTPGPLGAGGIAQVRLLLIDGRSPLYFAGGAGDLRAASARALADLRPTFGW